MSLHRRRFLLLAWNIMALPWAVLEMIQGRPWLGLGLLMSAHAGLFAGIFLPRLGLLGPVLLASPLPQQGMTLTIDDGPHALDTPLLLEILDQFGVKAIFFLVGQRAAAHPELTQEIARRGHRIGNHTWSHPAQTFWRAGPGRVAREIMRCQEILTSLTGQAPILFRPPAGFVSPFLHPFLRRNHLHAPALWTIRGFDGTDKMVERILRRVEAGLQAGAVVLIHEAQPFSDATGQRLAPLILRGVLEKAAKKHLQWS